MEDIKTQNFIEKASKIHNNKYEYFGKYIKSEIKFHINCSLHGSFYMKPSRHLMGQGCPECGAIIRRAKIIERNKKSGISEDEFLKRSFDVHGDRYDYSKTYFKGNRYHVVITCKIHGDFTQMAQAHTHNKQGCPKCAREIQRGQGKGNIEDFIKSSRILYGNRYDYSKVNLDNKINGNIEIICREHGSFYIKPSQHKKTQCKKCAFILRTEKIKKSPSTILTQLDFENRSRNVHGQRYEYSKAIYFRTNKTVIITCSIHGDFTQTPREHWSGSGCQKCANFATSQMENDWLTSINIIERRKCIRLSTGKVYVDGYDEKSKTVYEFFGDYWHGNPLKYSSDMMNYRVKKSFGQLYQETMKRIERLKNAGYNVVIMWESDWLVK